MISQIYIGAEWKDSLTLYNLDGGTMKKMLIYFRDRSYFEVDQVIYDKAVRRMEYKGSTTSDAQGVVEAQLLGKYRNLINRLCTNQSEILSSLQGIINKAKQTGYPIEGIEESFKAVCSQICTPRDISNLEIFLGVILKVDDELSEEEIRQITSLKKAFLSLSEKPTTWKHIF